jgi:hypothetical protein
MPQNDKSPKKGTANVPIFILHKIIRAKWNTRHFLTERKSHVIWPSSVAKWVERNGWRTHTHTQSNRRGRHIYLGRCWTSSKTQKNLTPKSTTQSSLTTVKASLGQLNQTSYCFTDAFIGKPVHQEKDTLDIVWRYNRAHFLGGQTQRQSRAEPDLQLCIRHVGIGQVERTVVSPKSGERETWRTARKREILVPDIRQIREVQYQVLL